MNAVADLAEDRELVATNIRLARRLAGDVSQIDLATRLTAAGLKVTHREVSRWEHGGRTPNPQTLRAIGKALGRSRGWFWDEHPELEGES